MPIGLEAVRTPTFRTETRELTAPRRAAPAFESLLSGIARRVDSGEALMTRALHQPSGGLEPAQWIALQAGIYRYVEALDLAGKLVDRVGNGIRTVLGTGQ